MTGHVVLHLRTGQTVRLPLRPRGRGVERPPVGNEALEAWLSKRSDVLVYTVDGIEFAHVEGNETPEQP